MHDMLLLAQASDPISGGAGWVGAGLLGAVLWWLLGKHLPKLMTEHYDAIKEKDEQLKLIVEIHSQHLDSMMARHDKKMDATLSAFALHSQEVREDHKDKMNIIIDHCKDESQARAQEYQAMAGVMHRDMDALRAAIEFLARSDRVKESNK